MLHCEFMAFSRVLSVYMTCDLNIPLLNVNIGQVLSVHFFSSLNRTVAQRLNWLNVFWEYISLRPCENK